MNSSRLLRPLVQRLTRQSSKPITTTTTTCSKHTNSAVSASNCPTISKLAQHCSSSKLLSLTELRPSANVISRRTFSDKKPERVNFTFLTTTGDRYETYGYEGDSLYDVVVNRSIPLDGFGACEATLACSTCHCILTEEVFDKVESELGMEMGDEELDMLDLAYGLTDTSRLGCQIKLCKQLEGIEVTVPAAVDARAGS